MRPYRGDGGAIDHPDPSNAIAFNRVAYKARVNMAN